MRNILFLLFITVINYSFSQNLLYNGSIEELKGSCIIPFPPYNDGAKHIFRIKGSPDLYNSCFVDTFPLFANWNHISVPKNNTGYQYARTGNGYIGFALWSGLNTYYNPFNYWFTSAEIPSFILKKKLKSGNKYCLEFWLTHCEISDYATDAIEAALSSDSLPINMDSIGYYYRISQRGKGIITDTLNWTKIHDTIIANGMEKYVHIGRFSKFDTSNVDFTGSSFPIISKSSIAYYLDDVTLYPCDTIAPKAAAGNDTLICKGDSAYIGEHNYEDYYYSWWHDSICAPNGSTEIQRDEHWGKIWVSPTKSTWYYVQATDFKFHKTLDSVFVKVLPCTCIKKDTTLCQGETYEIGNGDAYYKNFAWWPNIDINDTTIAVPIVKPMKSRWYYVIADDTIGGSIYDSVFISVKHCSPTINDTTICLGKEIIIGNNNPLYKSWIWSPANYLDNPSSATPMASPTNDITYYVSAIDTLGNVDEDTITVSVIDCDTTMALFIPNAFTPNADGLNDVFIYGNNELFTDIKTLIYNRWGELVYSSNTYEPWNGKFNGEFVQNGMYIYYITAVLKSGGETQVYKGNVMVLY